MLRALELLTDTDKTLDAVAKELGIGRRTLYQWRSDPFFRLAEDKKLEDVMNEARARIRAKVVKAVEVIVSALDCDAGACPIPDTAGGLSVTLGAAEALTHAVMSGEDAGTCDADR